jgi:DNA processing protein
MEEGNYWLGFSNVPGIGPAKFRKLLEKFGTAKSAWTSPRPGLGEILGEELAEKFDLFRKKFLIDDYLKELKRKGVWFLTLKDEKYPKLLREIKNPPFVLYGKGNIELPCSSAWGPVKSNPSRQGSHSFHAIGSPSSFATPNSVIGVVGARKTTQYGREVTKLLTTELVLAGFTIVSGLALGVDAVSHMTALENQGKTIAVLGCGVDCCNPRENQSIYDDILRSNNCIISEFPLGMKPTLWSFPARNRIIAGLSQAVLVTEGAEDSGSLITAEFALKFGRKVFAVPGPITSSMSKGPYKLIQKGAKLVTSGEDVLKELKIQKSKFKNSIQNSKIKGDTKEENLILKFLENEPLHFDELVRQTKFNSAKLSSILSMMEIKGMVENKVNYFSLTKG